MKSEIILSMKNVSKSFPGVKALDNVTFEVHRGEIHALVGENGAGKSTLMKILDGLYQPDSGVIEIEGSEVFLALPRDAIEQGIHIVHQELSTMDCLTVAENIFLGRLPVNTFKLVDYTKLHEMTVNSLKLIESGLKPFDIVGGLSIAEKQMIEIVKSVSFSPKILIMDEPTSSLSRKEIEKLFSILRNLNKKGVTIIYISHKLEEIFELCDRLTIMRDGKTVHTTNVKDIAKDKIIEFMVGRSVQDEFPERLKTVTDEEMFRVENLQLTKDGAVVNFSLKKGEILGFAGVVGSGRTEVMKGLLGVTKNKKYNFYKSGKKIEIRSVFDAIANGIAYLSESRSESLVYKSPVSHNITMVNMKSLLSGLGFINLKKEKAISKRYVDDLSIKTPSLEQYVLNLSGGNQQKVIIAKWLFNEPDVFIMDEPTRGIDVGAKLEIYHLMNTITSKGKSIIFISSELSELLAMSDRILVMRNGCIAGEIDREHVSPEAVMSLAIS